MKNVLEILLQNLPARNFPSWDLMSFKVRQMRITKLELDPNTEYNYS